MEFCANHSSFIFLENKTTAIKNVQDYLDIFLEYYDEWKIKRNPAKT